MNPEMDHVRQRKEVFNEKKLILSLCDHTGNWSQPYAEDPEYEVRRYDLLDGQDVRLLPHIDLPVHGILMAPPCTHFAASGACWWERKGNAAVLEGLQVIDACMRAVAVYQPKWWVLENPVGRLRKWLGAPKAYFHPHEYGGWLEPGERTHLLYPVQDAYTKRTCLWGEFRMPEKSPVAVAKVPPEVREDGSKRYTNYSSPHDLSFLRMKPAERAAFRSITPVGFARAFNEANP